MASHECGRSSGAVSNGCSEGGLACPGLTDRQHTDNTGISVTPDDLSTGFAISCIALHCGAQAHHAPTNLNANTVIAAMMQ
jgi:hypothetical protein